MANNLNLSNTIANAQANIMGPLFDNGYLRIYDSTQPATADSTISTQALLAELRFNTTAFGSSTGGVIAANALTADSSANNTGTATWFRCFQSDGTTPLMDGTVGAAACDLNLNSASISAGAEVAVTSFVHTVTK